MAPEDDEEEDDEALEGVEEPSVTYEDVVSSAPLSSSPVMKDGRHSSRGTTRRSVVTVSSTRHSSATDTAVSTRFRTWVHIQKTTR